MSIRQMTISQRLNKVGLIGLSLFSLSYSVYADNSVSQPLKPTTALALKQENHTVSREAKLSILFDKTVQGESYAYVKDAVATRDKGHIILSEAWEKKNDNAEYRTESGTLLIKIDDKGNKLWRKSLINKNDKVNDFPYAITATKDGGYTVLIYALSEKEDYSHIALLKVDDRGNKLWRKDYNIDGYIVPNDIKVNKQGEHIIVGYKSGGTLSSTQAFVLKADSAGNKIWHKSFGGKGWDEANSLLVTNDGGYIIAGSKQTVTADKNFYNYAAFVFKIDSAGKQIWEKTFYSKKNEQLSAVVAMTPTKNGEYLLVGTLAEQFSHYSGWSAKIDDGGKPIWHKTFKPSSSASNFSDPVDIVSTTNDEYIVIGSSMDDLLWRSSGRMVKLDTNGNQLLDKTFKHDKYNSFKGIVPANDNQYLIIGSEYNPNSEISIRIIKIADR